MTKSNQPFLVTIAFAFFSWHIVYLVVAYVVFFLLVLFEAGEKFANDYSFLTNLTLFAITFVVLFREGGYFRELFEFKGIKYRAYTILGFFFYFIFIILS